MRVQLKQQCKFGEVVYPRGQHEIPDSFADGWFFQALIKDGSAILLDGSPKQVAVPPVPQAPADSVFKEPDQSEQEPESEPPAEENEFKSKKKKK